MIDTLPGYHLQTHKMPGHWLLARLGKRVLRPGGIAMTRRMLRALAIRDTDSVVEFAPGLGATMRLVLRQDPATYVAVERDRDAAARLQASLPAPRRRCVEGTAEETGLPGGSATAVFGEAMLTMQPAESKRRILREARRLLRPGGRYAIHELCLLPEDLPEVTKQVIQSALTEAIHVGARPLTPVEWRLLLESEGFTVREERRAPMHLLEPLRLLRDEGPGGALRFALNLARYPEARRRVLSMRRVFRRYAPHLGAILLIGENEETR